MRFLFCIALLSCLLTVFGVQPDEFADRPAQTFANPLDLPYRFSLELPSHREAADPTVVYFHGPWWLFASWIRLTVEV